MKPARSPKRASEKRATPPAGCPLNDCLQFLAGAWTTEVIWYLKCGPRRFGDLKRDLADVSAKVLTARLRDLERRGVVKRTAQPTSPPTVEYRLTELGKKLQPVLDAIVEVGEELRKAGDTRLAEAAQRKTSV